LTKNRDNNGTELRFALLATMLIITVLYVLITSFVLTPRLFIPQYVTNITIMVVAFVLAAVAIAYFLRALTSQSKSRRILSNRLTALYERLTDTQNMLKETEKMLIAQTHTFLVYESVKEIQIVNSEGDGLIEYRFTCRNNLDKQLDRIRLSVFHDGTLTEDAVKCSVDGKQIKTTDLQRLITVFEDTREPAGVMSNTLKFSIIPEKPIQPDAKFRYEYSYKIRKLFPKVTTKNAEYTQTIVIHPTHQLRYIIKVPKNYVFDPAGIKFEVIDRDDIEFTAEEKRIEEECAPWLLSDNKVLLWNIAEPKLANLYRLYFSIREKLESTK